MKSLRLIFALLLAASSAALCSADSSVTHLRCEYLENPIGIDITKPRLSWRIESDQRGVAQKAYRIIVASSAQKLARGEADVWDSGKVASNETLHIPYDGKPLTSRSKCHWKVQVWLDESEQAVDSENASWSMGLLNDSDWTGDYISYQDDTPIHTDTKTLYLPAARQYRKEFAAKKEVRQATVYATALGIYELQLNGQKVGDASFAPGWTDYRQRAYYNTYDVTEMVNDGDNASNNAIGAWVADGWYSGYVGFGLLTGMGTEKNGRDTYGKTPSLMAQLEIEYTDGTRETIATDKSWKVTGEGPITEADLLMGEAYDARREMKGWSTAGFDASGWDNAILASENVNVTAMFYEGRNPSKAGAGPRITGQQRDLGFKRPKLQAFPGVPVRVTEEIAAKKVTKRDNGNYTFDLGQNFAGNIRFKVIGPKGHRITIRYGEMLHPDGRLMTENLRKARATDTYICRGDINGEVFEPRFTFHGFQFVEIENFPADVNGEPTTETVTGLVLHSDTPMTSTFTCSDPMVNQLFKNVVWTQRANFLDLPTDCPQRDERMGWTGDAQAYVGTAAYNADIGAFYTKWLRELMESQRPSGAFPGYAPYPFQHGWDFGSAWADAGVICPWTIWQAYGDTRVIDDCWDPMVRFMDWREATSKDDLGITHGNAWGDWLAQGAETPLDYVDTIYLAISAKMMSEMAAATGRSEHAAKYKAQFDRTKLAFQTKYLRDDGSINVNTQTAQALALFADLVPEDQRGATGRHLAAMIAENGNHMSTGFLGTRPLLPVLSASGQHDLATFLLQSREFPSWGYEIANGATTIWERWDSYTKEDAFGRHNAAMNSFSHYAFGAVCEWMFATLAGIQSDGPGYAKITIRPQPPAPGSNAMHECIDWVNASYDSIRGTIRSDWKIEGDKFSLRVTIPANTTATVYLPTNDTNSITEGGQSIAGHANVHLLRHEGNVAMLSVDSGEYEFVASGGIEAAATSLKTSKPKDTSINPDGVDLTDAKKIAHWDFAKPEDVAKWIELKSVEVQQRDGKAYLVATGDDSQMAARLNEAANGTLVISLRAMPAKGATSQFFWAMPGRGFNGTMQSKRPLTAAEQVNDYLFSIRGDGPVMKLRFDPFATFDKYADVGEMQIESISVYQLAK
ncbi:MAG: glycoside hydrolase family 78 protein [Pirellulaceae bacterium]